MNCPHLEYRREAGDRAFERARAYCTVADRFVEPMRADLCNDRYDLAHDRHCEIYHDHEGITLVELTSEGDIESAVDDASTEPIDGDGPERRNGAEDG